MAVSKKRRTFAPAFKKNAPVAQLVEHLTLNQGVQGSNPCGCTLRKRNLPFFIDIFLYIKEKNTKNLLISIFIINFAPLIADCLLRKIKIND